MKMTKYGQELIAANLGRRDTRNFDVRATSTGFDCFPVDAGWMIKEGGWRKKQVFLPMKVIQPFRDILKTYLHEASIRFQPRN